MKLREPEELEIAVRRFPRRHVEGYWDGCAWIGPLRSSLPYSGR